MLKEVLDSEKLLIRKTRYLKKVPDDRISIIDQKLTRCERKDSVDIASVPPHSLHLYEV